MARRNKRKLFKNIEVIDAGAKGKAVAKAEDGRVIFLSNAVPGDVVDIETYKQRKAYYEGKAVAFHKLSALRTEPKCQYFGTCGGCKWQDMDYQHQLEFKQKEVVNNLKRLGHLELPKVSPILGSKDIYYYRNKMEFSFSDSRWLSQTEIDSKTLIEDRNALGFHIPGMWDKIIDIQHCWLQKDPSNSIRNAIRSFAVEHGLPFFNTRQKTGLLRTLMIRTSSTGELMVLIQFFENAENEIQQLMQFLKVSFPEITSLLYVVNSKANDTLYDQDIICFAGRPFIYEAMEGLKFKINAKSFYQTNSEQAYELYKIARDYADLKGHELVYDLYTGTGTIAQFVAKKAGKVVGVEAVPEAIEAAKENAALNKIENASFYVGDMKQIFNDGFVEQNGMPDVVITDPPREGMHKAVVEQLLKINPKKIVYVSCNSATQARDLALMKTQYKITKVQPVDMFPQTHHVENVVLLEQISAS
jgi:23S rRNA (uracil1939-C5)-methyltransferase